MADEPFSYHLRSALARLRRAIDDLDTVTALPSFELLDKRDRARLRLTRDNLSRDATVINLILPLAIDAIYVQGKLPDTVLDTLEIAQNLLQITKSDNAEPPGPE